MKSVPAISIVVLTADADVAGRATLESLGAQDYPALEVLSEPCGPEPAGALNRAFARAKGQILGYLHAGEMLLPGVLRRVAAAMGAGGGREVLLGRSLMRFDGIPAAAVEHPSEYLGRFEHLAIWKRGFDSVPTASLFWSRAALDRVGGFNPGPRFTADYDFTCRLGRRYYIHAVDEPWSICSVDAAMFQRSSEAQMLADLVAVSRRYWGSWLSPLRWRCEASWRVSGFGAHELARHHARRAEAMLAQGHGGAARIERIKTWAYSREMASGRFGSDRR